MLNSANFKLPPISTLNVVVKKLVSRGRVEAEWCQSGVHNGDINNQCC